MRSILEVADAAEVIVNGYAFTKAGNNVKVLNCSSGDGTENAAEACF